MSDWALHPALPAERILTDEWCSSGRDWVGQGRHLLLDVPVRLRARPDRSLLALIQGRLTWGAILPAVVDFGELPGGTWWAEEVLPPRAAPGTGSPTDPATSGEVLDHLATLARVVSELEAAGEAPAAPSTENIRLDQSEGGRSMLRYDPWTPSHDPPVMGLQRVAAQLLRVPVDAPAVQSHEVFAGLSPLGMEWRWFAARCRRLARQEMTIAAFPEGRRVVGERYEFLGPLGSGGMGRTFRAVDRLSGAVVCVKVGLHWRPEQRDDALEGEFRLLATLRHPNIVRVLDFGRDSFLGPFVVSELLEDAPDLVRAGEALSLAERVELSAQLFDALDYLHRQGVVHADVKPSNILVANHRVRVLDFGLSSLVSAVAPSSGVRGTPGYIAPELLREQPASPSSDIWAAAAVAWLLITGEAPFPPMWQYGPLPPPRGLIPEALRRVLLPLLAIDPRDRPAAADLAAAALRTVRPFQASGSQGASFAFVGRQDELAAADAILKRLSLGQGGTLLFEGPLGIGKTRLLEEIRARAVLVGVGCVMIRGVREARRPLDVWRPLYQRLDAERLGLAEPAPPLEGTDAARHRLGSRLAMVETMERPLLLLVDDLQWLGDDDHEFLVRLVSQVDRAPFAVVLAQRTTERTRIPVGSSRQLPPLSAHDAHRLAALVDREGSEVPEEAQGVPLLLVEAMRARARGGTGRGGVQEICAERLAQLPMHSLPVLRLAAELGRVLEPELLDAAHLGDVASAVNAAHELGAVEWIDGSFRFAHDAFRDAMLASLSSPDRIALSLVAAELVADEDRVDHGRAAWHFARADEPRQAHRHAALAAESSFEQGALREVLRLTKQVNEEEVAEDRRPRLAYIRGESLYSTGENTEGASELRRACARAGVSLPSSPLTWMIRFTWELGRWATSRFRIGSVNMTPSLKVVQMALTHLGIERYIAGSPGEGITLALVALNLALETADWGVVSRQYGGLQLTCGVVGARRLADWFGQKAADSRARGGAQVDHAHGRAAAVYYLVELGDWAGAEAGAEWALGVFGAAGLVRSRDEMELALGWSRWLQGDLPRASLSYENVHASALRQGDGATGLWSAVGLAMVNLDRGAPASSLRVLARFEEDDCVDPAALLSARCLAHLRLGQYDECFETGVRAVFRSHPAVLARGPHYWPSVLVGEAFAELTLGAPPALRGAEPVIRKTLREAVRRATAHRNVAPMVIPPLHYVRGLLALAEDPRRAAAAFTEGRLEAERRGMRGWVHRAEEGLRRAAGAK